MRSFSRRETTSSCPPEAPSTVGTSGEGLGGFSLGCSSSSSMRMADKDVVCLAIEVDAGAMKAPAVEARRDRRRSFMVMVMDVVGCLCSKIARSLKRLAIGTAESRTRGSSRGASGSHLFRP